MNCQHVQTLLSRYHDGELDAPEQASVEKHLQMCVPCQSALASLRELSDLAASLTEPEPPGNLWQRVAEKLPPGRKTRARSKLLSRWAMLAAAVVLVAAGTNWLTHKARSTRDAIAASAESEGPLLDDLLAVRTAEPVTLKEAAQLVSFQVLNSTDKGCQFERCCLCKSGYCDIVQCHMRCGGEQLLLVQGSPDHPVRYGNRAVLETQINGQPARVAQCDGCLACSWQKQGTALTLVGPRDLGQLVQLMAYVDQHLSDKP